MRAAGAAPRGPGWGGLRAGRGGGSGAGLGVGAGGSLCDEVLHLLPAQEGVRPPHHSLNQAQLLQAAAQAHSLDPISAAVRAEVG